MVEQDLINITDDEAELYDRQIRLWGLDAQKRLRSAKVLLIGIGGLGAEIAKNIILAGIKSLTILDSQQVSEKDLSCQFLVDQKQVGENRAVSSLKRAQQLNPMVEVTTDVGNVDEKPDEFFAAFDIVCATCCSREQLLRLDEICHSNNVKFFAGAVFGWYGGFFADLGSHEFAEEVAVKKKAPTLDGEPAAKKAKTDQPETVVVKKVVEFSQLKAAFSIDWSLEENLRRLKKTPKSFFIMQALLEFRGRHGRDMSAVSMAADKAELLEIRKEIVNCLGIDESSIPEDFVEHCYSELSPVCAITGGILGQELIKAVSKKDAPHNNMFFYDGIEGSGTVDQMC